MYEDFERWYYETYGKRVQVEYSCFGTNEELYNMLTLGDVYDLVCPSEYMIMKLMAEDELVPFSESFFDTQNEHNDYIRRVSQFIQSTFEKNKINGHSWSEYAAGYMWGVTGIVYNPEEVTPEEAGTWTIINNDKFNRQVTIKDNVRDALFAALGALKAEELLEEDFLQASNYKERLNEEMNDISKETLQEVQEYLQEVKDNVYSFETDSGKADMITKKVLAGYQWSGDAVYSMDQAEEDDFQLNFAVPKESTNLYFDGWVMLKNGIQEDANKQHAEESFINFLSKPENVVRNMYYIGYTSVISGGDSNMVYDYADWCYGAEEDAEETVDYPLGFFFSGNPEDEAYCLTVEPEQVTRQLGAQYPTSEILERSVVMRYLDTEENAAINQMWINVRCFNINRVPTPVLVVVLVLAAAVMGVILWKKLEKKE